ncbi:uncharacterized protein BT62DRAFT_1070483 [Guyanagaster necrorhizus]|uniref:DUF1168-domain-containing protein n=1 Tax=Guyanagaster necrorhizus TaxID=856835 RepID=A0A9P7W5U6_9AGAR|nr:uncharacterized protein BT62DRAFT_1070483 [Guyanagaster necrorhizus MCA 3950]KAG7452759.1 hypothetical protein BT62DRAFT_1070483 [Guyanagaster necrorhizus MCA 3950]
MTTPAASSSGPAVNRHAMTAIEKQRMQLDKLLKDPTKAAYVPPPPKEKTIRPAREMMKNVQGSSAGAGSGEFHVYKASRRREYERLKLLEETVQKETDEANFERRRREAEAVTAAKTAKNRAKRQKKKERSKTHGAPRTESPGKGGDDVANDVPIKKRRLVNGKELVFRKPGKDSDEDSDDTGPVPEREPQDVSQDVPLSLPQVLDGPKITIHEDD